LDLHKRYAPKSQSCFWLPFQRCCKPWTKKNNGKYYE
jgi:hypothetical protein